MSRGGFRLSSVKERINIMKRKDSNKINKSVERDINVCMLEISLALDKMKNGQDKEIGKHIRMLKVLTLLLQSMRDELNTYGVVDVQRINSVWSLFDDRETFINQQTDELASLIHTLYISGAQGVLLD